MSSLTKDIIITTLFSFCCGLLGFWVLTNLIASGYFSSYPFIPLFFYIYALIASTIITNKRKKESELKKLFYAFITLKVIKIVLSLAIVIVYVVAFQNTAKQFSLTFITFYLLFLVYDTWFFSKTQKKEIK